MAGSAVQSQKTVTAYFPSKQLLPFGFADGRICPGCPRGSSPAPFMIPTCLTSDLSWILDSVRIHGRCDPHLPKMASDLANVINVKTAISCGAHSNSLNIEPSHRRLLNNFLTCLDNYFFSTILFIRILEHFVYLLSLVIDYDCFQSFLLTRV